MSAISFTMLMYSLTFVTLVTVSSYDSNAAKYLSTAFCSSVRASFVLSLILYARFRRYGFCFDKIIDKFPEALDFAINQT